MVCRRFPETPGFRVPHMAWNGIALAKPSPLFPHLDADSRFYFVHSYYMDCRDPGLTVATVDYSVTYACAVTKDNIHGVQFHPEKSLRHGLALMQAFAAL
jgi:glutamine amidotransferase